MSGTRTRDPLASLIARQVPTYQIPVAAGRGAGYRYPQFGGEPRTAPALPAPRIGAAPIIRTPDAAGQGGNGANGAGGGQAAGPTGDAADAGAPHSGFAERSGWGVTEQDPNSPLGPDPGRMNSLADVASVARTMGNFATGAVLGGPLGAVRAAANSPVGMGIAKSLSALTGISAATPAPSDLSSLSKPNPDEQSLGRTAMGVVGALTGFGGMLGGLPGGPKGEAPKGAPAATGVDKNATAAAPTAAAPTAAAPAPAPAAGEAPASKDFGDAAADSFNAENTTPGSESKSESTGGADGGKGDAAGTGANGENSSPGGGDKGGEFRMGGQVQPDTDGHLAAVPILAHENEFVLSPEATAMIGPDLLQRINDMALEAAGHPPRPQDPRFMGSPLGQLRAGQVPPTFVSVSNRRPQAVVPPGGYADPGVAAWDQQERLRGQQAAQQGMADHMGAQGQGIPSAAPMPMPPTPPPGAPARGMARAQPRGGMTADDLNAMSLSIAQGNGAPPQGAQERLAYERIRGVMRPGEEPQQFRMGGMVQGPGAAGAMPASMKGRGLMPEESDTYDHDWGQSLPHGMMGWALSPMPTLGYEGDDAGPQGPMEFGYEDLIARFGGDEPMPAFRMGGLVEAPQQADPGGDMPGGFLPRSARPYANEGEGDMPFGDDPATQAGAGQADFAQRLMALPPDMQQAVAMAIGGDPMVASALLHVMGPHFGPIIEAAMKVASPPRPDPLAQLTAGGPPMGAPMPAMG